MLTLLQETLDRAKDYIKEVKKQGSANVVIMLAANKTDLESQRKVPTKVGPSLRLPFSGVAIAHHTQDGEAAANELDVFFSETSAKTGEGVKELFMLLGTPCYWPLALWPLCSSRVKRNRTSERRATWHPRTTLWYVFSAPFRPCSTLRLVSAADRSQNMEQKGGQGDGGCPC
jgi:hypothetical protein